MHSFPRLIQGNLLNVIETRFERNALPLAYRRVLIEQSISVRTGFNFGSSIFKCSGSRIAIRLHGVPFFFAQMSWLYSVTGAHKIREFDEFGMKKKREEFRARLRRVRNELHDSQKAFAIKGGVTEKTQSNYEKGAREPGLLYLLKLAAAGVNVGYLLTGQEFEQQLAPAEQELLRELRKINPQDRDEFIIALCVLVKKLPRST
ncbi:MULTISPECIES: helix-turn-helix domain-containing protein [Paraburkholderia]|nr:MULTISPECIES: helix-turn-helix transcriptional regulator [Paraburkholderia]